MKVITRIEYHLSEEELKDLNNQREKLKVSYYKLALKNDYTPAYWCYVFKGRLPVSDKGLKRLLQLGFKFNYKKEN